MHVTCTCNIAWGISWVVYSRCKSVVILHTVGDAQVLGAGRGSAADTQCLKHAAVSRHSHIVT